MYTLYNINKYAERVISFLEKTLKKRLEILNLILFICTGYSFEIIMNAFTISSLIQISIKLLLSLVNIKLNLMWQFGVLLLLVPVYLKYNTFDYIRTKIADFLYDNINQNIYAEKINEHTWTGAMDSLPEILAEKNAWYNKGLVLFINFLIGFRLFVLQEPIISLILKFMTIRYFFENEYLPVAYTISFIFIFSRFIFLLSDGNIKRWKLSLSDTTLENVEEIPKINKKNVKIMTFWSLRHLDWWEVQLRTNKNILQFMHNNKYYFEEVLIANFFTMHEKIPTTKSNKKLKAFIFCLILGFLSYNYGNYEYLSLSSNIVYIKTWRNNAAITKIPKLYPNSNKTQPEKIVFDKTKEHFALVEKKVSKISKFEFFRYSAWSTLKKNIPPLFNVPPWTRPLSEPPTVVISGNQGLAGISFQTVWRKEFESLFGPNPISISNSPIPAHLQNLTNVEIDQISECVDDENIKVMPETLSKLSIQEENYLKALLQTKYPLTYYETKCLWSVFEKQSVNLELSKDLLNRIRKDLIKIPELNALMYNLDQVLKFPNPYRSPYFDSSQEQNYEELLKRKYSPILNRNITKKVDDVVIPTFDELNLLRQHNINNLPKISQTDGFIIN